MGIEEGKIIYLREEASKRRDSSPVVEKNDVSEGEFTPTPIRTNMPQELDHPPYSREYTIGLHTGNASTKGALYAYKELEHIPDLEARLELMTGYLEGMLGGVLKTASGRKLNTFSEGQHAHIDARIAEAAIQMEKAFTAIQQLAQPVSLVENPSE